FRRVLFRSKEDGIIIIVASHLLENLDDYADQIYFLNEQRIYYTYVRSESHREYVKGYISEDKLKFLSPLREGTLYLDGDRICIPADDLPEEEVFKMMSTLKKHRSAEVSLRALGTNEHYLRIYKGERKYEKISCFIFIFIDFCI